MKRRVVLGLILAAFATSGWSQAAKKPDQPAPIYMSLRAQALALKAADIGAKQAVYGVIMEIGYPEAVATLVSLADGTTSLYFSNGGGQIGAGDSPKVAKASKALVFASAQELAKMTLTTETPLPQLNHTRFYVLTTSGVRTADALEDDLGEHRHPLSQLFYWGQGVLTEIRLQEESRAHK
jgi:hypothetical protein